MKKITKKFSLTPKQQQKVIKYCDDDMKELKRICDPLIFRKRVPGMLHDDLYDIASDVLLVSVTQYDEDKGASFETYLTGNIRKAFYDWTRDNLRGKRCNVVRDSNNGKIIKADGRPVVIPDIRLNDKTEDGTEIGEMIDSGFRVEDEISIGVSSDEKIEKYFSRLSKRQRKIVLLLADGYLQEEIRELLHMDKKEYAKNLLSIKSYENIRILL